MNFLKEKWFSEVNNLWPGSAYSLEVEQILYNERSKYQDILVVKTKSHGVALILDNVIQCTEKDEFAYHEMISFLPLCCHSNPKDVLIIGGGDGGAAREVAKHPDVKRVVLVDIDNKVMEICEKYLPSLSSGLKHPKVNVKACDGLKYLEDHPGEFDVIITDSCDPIGPAEHLFGEKYYKSLKAALKPGGIIASQGGTAWESIEQVKRTLHICKETFGVAAYAVTSVPTYPTGQIGFVMGSLNNKINFAEPIRIFSDEELNNMEMKYYNDRIHRAAFVLPTFIEKELSSCSIK